MKKEKNAAFKLLLKHEQISCLKFSYAMIKGKF